MQRAHIRISQLSRFLTLSRSLGTMSQVNHAVLIHAPGGFDVVKYEEVPKPQIKPTEVLVRNRYAGINFIENYFRSGIYKAEYPLILGREGAGEVVEVGSEVKEYKVGDKIGYSTPGAFANFTAVDVNKSKIIKATDKVDLKLLTASFIQGLTAYTFVHEAYDVKKGDYILIHAVAGGTGAILAQLALLRGAYVIGTTSTDEKAAYAKSLGVQTVINYKKEDIVQRVKEVTDGKGVIAVFDGVGKTTFDISLEALARKGTLVSFGNASGLVPPVPLFSLNTKNIKLLRPTFNNYVATPEEWEFYSTGFLKLLEQGDIKVPVTKVYSLEETGKALEDLAGGTTTGKLLVEID